jgi:Ni,Fe-hydrogenase I cytochrome b subunit
MKYERVKVYVWEVPVRFTHWINAICLLALSFTGIYIGDPYTHAQSADQFIMGWMRFIHLTAAYALMMSIIIRIYWFIMGNRYSSISEWTRISALFQQKGTTPIRPFSAGRSVIPHSNAGIPVYDILRVCPVLG